MIIKNGTIFTEEGKFCNGNIGIEGDKISDVHRGEVIDATGLYVLPGLIDIHFHGCAGFDFCDGTAISLEKMSQYQLQNGITSICPASMTLPEEKLMEIFANAAGYSSEKGATVVGINMEGPFISREKKGAQNEKYICNPNKDMYERLQKSANGLIKLISIAPETEGAMEFIEKIHSEVTVSLGHTMADYETAFEAFKRGARHVTHLYNAMPPYNHRQPGLIGASCDNEKVTVELICDNVHCHPSTVRTTFKMFGDDRIVFISDSMMACGMEDGQYKLGGQDVTVKGRRAILTDLGNIAGSVTNLMECLRIAVKEMNIPLESAVKCVTANPARAIGIYDNYGSLTLGKQADMVLLDKNLDIKYVIKAGKGVIEL